MHPDIAAAATRSISSPNRRFPTSTFGQGVSNVALLNPYTTPPPARFPIACPDPISTFPLLLSPPSLLIGCDVLSWWSLSNDKSLLPLSLTPPLSLISCDALSRRSLPNDKPWIPLLSLSSSTPLATQGGVVEEAGCCTFGGKPWGAQAAEKEKGGCAAASPRLPTYANSPVLTSPTMRLKPLYSPRKGSTVDRKCAIGDSAWEPFKKPTVSSPRLGRGASPVAKTRGTSAKLVSTATRPSRLMPIHVPPESPSRPARISGWSFHQWVASVGLGFEI
mmetsp:Transcript_6813/g.10516  ORF Transcript_6813/g.10516 Transcript_6813/m.10516 type:complete len:277 (+) Transcript_6813:597-1427(+)